MERAVFDSHDLSQLESQGVSPETAAAQLERMSRGFPRIDLDRPCTVGDGLLRLTTEEHADCIEAFERARAAGRISKFVPASGAATRMFQALLSVHTSRLDLSSGTLGELESGGPRRETLLAESGVNPLDLNLALRFLREVREFPFASELAATLGVDLTGLGDLYPSGEGRRVLEATLGESGLGFASLPKGLIPFHGYPDGSWTPFGEHLAEGWELLGEDPPGRPIGVHFTVPPGFEESIRLHLDEVARQFPGGGFAVGLSIQSQATDTVAGDPDGGPFRAPGGRLVFRPGGHGALLENLGNLGGDVVLLKNVDNIAHRSWRQAQHEFRKMLAGLVVLLEERVAGWRTELASIAAEAPGMRGGSNLPGDASLPGSRGLPGGANLPEDAGLPGSHALPGGAGLPVGAALSGGAVEGAGLPGGTGVASRLDALESEYAKVFSRTSRAPGEKEDTAARVERLGQLLARPIRVCAMVVNEGEPGGGPFWVRHPDGSVDIQIVELSQIDGSDPAQARVVEGATHFNPVDLALSLRGPDGKSFDLHEFVDWETGIVTEKSDRGQALRALELPGLWNGSMARWNTVFVEVPIETFTPVKTVLDLLRPPHKGKL